MRIKSIALVAHEVASRLALTLGLLHGHFQGPLNVLSVHAQVAHQGSVSN